MNERIREFAEQAFTAVGTTHDSITHQDQSVLDKNDTVTVYTFTQNTMEKFAELLIGEYAEEVRQFNDGERVVLPKNREHAEAMVRVGMHYLEQNK